MSKFSFITLENFAKSEFAFFTKKIGLKVLSNLVNNSIKNLH